MLNRCCIEGCTGYDPKEPADISISTTAFHFPLKKPELLKKWIRFTNKQNWQPTSSSVLCERHFHEDSITRGKGTTLKWNLNPIPTKFRGSSENHSFCYHPLKAGENRPK